MLRIFRTLRGLLKFHVISIDNNFFILHYKITVVILLALAMLVTSQQFFKNPMECNFSNLPLGSLNTYCYVHATFLEQQQVTHVLPQRLPGGNISGETGEKEFRFYNYYEWVYLTLAVQAILFYVPHYVWKAWEGGKMKMLAVEFACPVLSEDFIEENMIPVVEFFCTTLHSHNAYAYKYFTCEFFNLVNVVGQILFLNAFLGEEFASFGIDVITFDHRQEKSMKNPIDRLFPIVTRCSYHKYGPSGKVENWEGLCLLPENSLNGKIYIFMWFWFHILTVISSVVVIYRIVTLLSPTVRLYRFKPLSGLIRSEDIAIVFPKLNVGDWFLLCRLQRNINPLAYKKVISSIAEHFGTTVADA